MKPLVKFTDQVFELIVHKQLAQGNIVEFNVTGLGRVRIWDPHNDPCSRDDQLETV